MRKASRIVAEILEELAAAVRPGVTTFELDKLAEELTYRKGAKPAFKGYKPGDVPYPKTLCVSVNEEIVHGIPSSRKLKQGDIVGLDFGVVYEGFYGDSARTVAVGKVPEHSEKLLRVTREALYTGIEQAARAIGSAISRARCRQCRKRGIFGGRGVRGPWHRPAPPRGSPSAELFPARDAESAAQGGDGHRDRADGE